MISKEVTANDEPGLFLVQGRLSEIHVERDRENLLQKIDQHYKGKAVITGAGAIVGDMFGQAASAASLAMYDGEDTQNFACLIDDQVMCGQFGGAEWLAEKHIVKAVVSKQGDVLFSHAVMDETAGTLWIGHPWGSKAESLANWKLAWFGFIFQFLCFVLFGYFLGTRNNDWTELLVLSIGGGGALCFGMALWNSHTMQGLAEPSTEMFRLLGFASPESVNLNGYQLSLISENSFKALGKTRNQVIDMNEYQKKNVFYYRQAIEDGKLSLMT
jgi:hypothetical protein